jgi:hypothetical protein
LDIGDSDPDDDRLASFRGSVRPDGATWDDIELNDGSIILGSAGSGKTTEVLEAAKRFRQKGVPAFVLRLEALCRQPVKQSFSQHDPDGENAFTRWKGSNKPAVAFLDALDEARLPEALNGSVLNDAFAQLWDSVGTSGRELKIVVTTRASEWHGPTDFKIVTQFLNKLRANPDPKYEPRAVVYRLAPLRHSEVEQLASSRLPSTKEFIQAIGKAKASDLAKQPFEVHILVDTWEYELSRGTAPEKVFASRLDLFETAVSARLQTEQGQERRSNLDPTGAREASEKLAAAIVLTGIRDLSARPGIPLTINPLAVLANGTEPWNEIEVRQLLSSALFQPSVGGKVRFSHRELQDFLAAKFFDRQMRENAGSLELIEPLFAESHGSQFVPQETEQVIGWLSTLNRTARNKVISIRPSLLIEAGDPLRLSAEGRGEAMRAHVALYSDRRYRGEWFAPDDVTKFATPELAPVVAEMLARAASPEVREFLVEAARFGQMTTLADKLAVIATNSLEAFRVRAEACHALKEFGDRTHAEAVFQSSLYDVPMEGIHEAPSWNLFQISALLCAFPHSATILDAITAISRLRREASNYTSMNSALLQDFGTAIPENETSSWLGILLRFAAGPRGAERDQLPLIVPRYRLLKDLILDLTIRLLQQPNWRDNQETLLDALEYLANRGDNFSLMRSKYDEILELLVPNIELKRALIERRLKLFPSQPEKPPQLYGVIEAIKMGDKETQRSVFSFADVAGFASDIEVSGIPRERLIAFEIANLILDELPLDEKRRGSGVLQKAVQLSGDTALNALMPSAWIRWLRVRRHRFRHSQQYALRHWVRRKIEGIVALRWRVQNFLTFLRKRKSLRSGENIRALLWAVRQVPNDLGNGTINSIRANYGALVAGWFSHGYRAFWRRHTLAVFERNTYIAHVGLAGLALDARHGSISGTELEIANALGYGLCNLNGVPDWFVDVAKANRAVFIDLARRVIADEFDASAIGSPDPTDGLRKIIDADPGLRDDIAPILLLQMQTSTSFGRANLELCLRVIGLSKTVDATLAADFLEAGFRVAFVRFDFATAWMWLDSLFHINSSSAWSCLVSVLGDVWSDGAGGLFRTFLGRDVRYGGRSQDRNDDRDHLATNSLVLGRLIRATYIAWPPNRDPFHEEAYSPGTSDRATDRRRYYVATLGRSGDKAVEEFDWLIANPQLTDHSESFKYERDQMIRSTARRPSFDASQATVFLNEFSKAPETVAEFRSLVRRHLRALLDQLHLSDADESYVFRRGDATEDDLRNWLAGRMREMGDRHYSVIREQEVAKENRPDLRVIARTKELGNVSVEIKLADADHWSGNILKDKLKTQLADQYMHEFESHSGIYLLANAAKPRIAEYDKKTGKILRPAFRKKIEAKFYDFKSLIELLEKDAQLLCSGSMFVEVMAVDLSER